jgi:UDP-glucuronate 4-epimerase
MRILITGTAGFIGFHVALRLLGRKGTTVIGLDNMNDYYDPILKRKRNAILKKYKNYRFYKVDIENAKRVGSIFKKEKPNVVIHLAAQAGVRYSLENPWIYANSNYLGTLSIFEASRHNKVDRVLYASSSSVYGSNTKTPFSETDRTDTPLSLYAATKKANEVLAYAYHHLFGMDMVGFRFFTVYGPWGRPDMALFNFVKAIHEGGKITLFNKGNMSRSFTYINDVIEPLVRFLDVKKKLGYRIYNLGGGAPTTVKTMVKMLETILKKKAIIFFGPMHVADVPTTNSDIRAIKKDIKFTPRVSMSKGLKKFVQWYLEHENWLSKLEKPKQ